ncbi:MAG: cobalamin-independent methionine synthase II family protein [Deltaproteobacteria bacterium]|nr:cobalamin-independent methionine synthase II family protein [Deltaproteobacteria bacterium]
MLRSEKRILTTHAGSLPRTARLKDLLVRKNRGETIDRAELEREVEQSTRRVVAKQLEAGIDIGNNGEQPRESFFTYIHDRMSGFGGRSERRFPSDIAQYPSYLEKMRLGDRQMIDLMHAPMAVGEVRYQDRKPLERECADFKRLLAEPEKSFAEPFLTAPSPGIVAAAMHNRYYDSLEKYLFALADALRVEYRHIVESGCVLQIDAPDLAMERHTSYADRPLSEFIEFVDMTIGAINHGIEGLAADRVRLHVCWGNYEAPHHLDVPLEEILPHLYGVKAGALVLEAANPRHQHEYRCFRSNPLPDHMLLVTGVIDTKTNYVEHPEVIAERLQRAAHAVGDPHRVIAGTDCGFETTIGLGDVAEELVWEKLKAMRAGADLASKVLFGG